MRGEKIGVHVKLGQISHAKTKWKKINIQSTKIKQRKCILNYIKRKIRIIHNKK